MTSNSVAEVQSCAPLPVSLLCAAIDGDREAITIMDRSFRFIAVNAAWKLTMGFGDEVIGRTMGELFGAETQSADVAFGPVLAGQEVIKTFRTSQDGRLQHVTMTPWRDETGAVGGIITRFSITDEQQMASEGRERRLRMAMETANIFAFEIDFRSGNTVFEPPRPDHRVGGAVHSHDDVLNLLPERQRQERRELWEQHLTTGGPMIVESQGVGPTGDLSWYRTISESTYGLEGEVVGIVGVLQIIDEQKQAELALVAEKEAAQAADRAKRDFLANMSHEIRTPLTSVIGFADLASRLDGLPDMALDYIQKISGAGESLLCVINDILDFSKLEAGQLELNPQPFTPSKTIQAVVEILAPQAAAKGIDLHSEIGSDVPDSIVADSSRLRQILINLIGNAVKFTDKGRVTIKATYEDGPEGGLTVSVVDTGAGIADDVRNRLFQRFSQVDGSVSRRHGGTGLGLAISKSLVDLMGGAIGCDSAPGEGSTFWLTIPAALAEAPDDQEPVGDGEAPEQCRPAHILIVDDLAANREIVRALLGTLGHTFEEVDNGADAVKAAMQSAYDLILMDLQMPVMDGMSASRAIRASAELNKTTPILAFSANVMLEHRAAALAAGMDDHIGKPIKPMELLSKVTMWTSLPRRDLPDEIAAVS
jgi:signal transduction histidine kinase/AmiR/NasT family two-component response regulator